MLLKGSALQYIFFPSASIPWREQRRADKDTQRELTLLRHVAPSVNSWDTLQILSDTSTSQQPSVIPTAYEWSCEAKVCCIHGENKTAASSSEVRCWGNEIAFAQHNASPYYASRWYINDTFAVAHDAMIVIMIGLCALARAWIMLYTYDHTWHYVAWPYFLTHPRTHAHTLTRHFDRCKCYHI